MNAWHFDSRAGAYLWETSPLTSEELLCRDEEINWLIRHEQKNWKLINGRISGSGVPVAMAEGTYGALGAYPAPALANVTLTSTEAALLSATTGIPVYTPLPINGILAPQAYRFVIGGTYTGTTSLGSLVTSFRFGNANTSPLLGTSASTAITASLTNASWLMKGDITVRSIGAPGANSTAYGQFTLMINTAVGGAYGATLWSTGASAVSFDSTIALGANGGGMWVGVSDTGATNHATLTPQTVHWMDWN